RALPCKRLVVRNRSLRRLYGVVLGIVVELLLAAERAEVVAAVHELASDGCLLVVNLHTAHWVDDSRHGCPTSLSCFLALRMREESDFVICRSRMRNGQWAILALHLPLCTIMWPDG